MTSKRLVHVLGAGGHAKVVIRSLERCGYQVAGAFDDDPLRHGKQILGVPILGPLAQAARTPDIPAVIAIGDNQIRQRVAERLRLDWITVVDPGATADPSASIGAGTVVLPGAIVQVDARVGQHAIINHGATVDHDCQVGDFAHLAPGTHLAGNVRLGVGVLMGIGAVAVPEVCIGEGTTVGAGATVVRDLPARVLAKGVPARVAAHLDDADASPEPRRESPAASNAKNVSPAGNRIYLSPPHMSPRERELLLEAFDSNWIAPLGPHVDTLEREFAAEIGVADAAAVSSGTAAIHLALMLLGAGPGDEVLTSTLTFAATANAITYTGARPVFLDSDRRTWNMDPELLEEELEDCARRGRLPKAVVVVDLYGQCADYEPILKCCQRFGVPIVEDAAEALGATYGDRAAGTFGRLGCFSLNGNKIITASGGGVLVSDDLELIRKARFLATQARDPAPHYQHSHIGYNYRMSNLLAAVARGQLSVLADRVARRRANFEYYERALGDLRGIQFMPEHPASRATRWLTCITVDPRSLGASREDLRLALETENIESRPVWKPLHLQPAFAGCRVRGGTVAESLFRDGLCLPSGSSLTEDDQRRIVTVIREVAEAARNRRPTVPPAMLRRVAA